jgi:hypothetical protein
MLLVHVEKGEHNKIFKTIFNVWNKMKHDLTTGTWQDDTGCPISIVLAATSDDCGADGRIRRIDRGSPGRPGIRCRISGVVLAWAQRGLGLPQMAVAQPM